jgi:hypothetical protein
MIGYIYLGIALVFVVGTHWINQRSNPNYRLDSLATKATTLAIIGALWPLALVYMLAPRKWTRKLDKWVDSL